MSSPFVWEVSGATGSIVVVATHQGAGPDDVTAGAWTALDQANVFVAEADEVGGFRNPREGDAAFYLPEDVSLSDRIPRRDVIALTRALDGELENIERLQPWVAFVLLGTRAYPPPGQSINEALLERARKRGIATEFLETWESQVQYLQAAITPAKLSAAIHDFSRLHCELAYRLAAFRAGDDAVFVNEVKRGEPVVARIERWTVRVEDYLLAGRRAYVAVGIGQLVGPYGMLARLAARGYRVMRLR